MIRSAARILTRQRPGRTGGRTREAHPPHDDRLSRRSDNRLRQGRRPRSGHRVRPDSESRDVGPEVGLLADRQPCEPEHRRRQHHELYGQYRHHRRTVAADRPVDLQSSGWRDGDVQSFDDQFRPERDVAAHRFDLRRTRDRSVHGHGHGTLRDANSYRDRQRGGQPRAHRLHPEAGQRRRPGGTRVHLGQRQRQHCGGPHRDLPGRRAFCDGRLGRLGHHRRG